MVICVFVSNDLETRELPFVNTLLRESVFEISAIEIVDLKMIIVYINPKIVTRKFSLNY
jgi:hypothetical protein